MRRILIGTMSAAALAAAMTDSGLAAATALRPNFVIMPRVMTPDTPRFHRFKFDPTHSLQARTCSGKKKRARAADCIDPRNADKRE